jgi:transglutaminase-like putative cysteine protease
VRYRVVHASEYQYTNPAALSLNEACLSARGTAFQTVERQSFVTEPEADYARNRTDWFGNNWRFYAFEKPHTKLRIVSTHEVEVERRGRWGDGFDGGFEPFVFASPFVPLGQNFADYGLPSFPQGGDTAQGLAELTGRIFRDFTYDPKATDISTPVEVFFKKRRGVCQDFSHFMLAVLRSLGVPARYVSGYLNTLPPPGKDKVWGADASHAWVQAYAPGHGWIDLDPTNGIVVGDDHITLAWGRDYGDVTPLRGVVLGGGTQKLKVEVTVLTIS